MITIYEFIINYNTVVIYITIVEKVNLFLFDSIICTTHMMRICVFSEVM